MTRCWRGRTMADRLTLSRVAAAPLILGAALLHSPRAFAMLLAWGLLSDIADGAVARARGEVSPAGAALDSRADVAFYGSTLLALGILIPAKLAGEWRLLAVVIAAYTLPIAIGWWKFGRLTSYHTVLARLALALLVTGLGSWIIFDQLTVLRLGVAVLVVSAVEEVLLTLLLDSALDNVGHLFAILSITHDSSTHACTHSAHCGNVHGSFGIRPAHDLTALALTPRLVVGDSPGDDVLPDHARVGAVARRRLRRRRARKQLG